MRALGLAIVSSAILACGGASVPPSSVEPEASSGAVITPAEENVLGLADDAFPELAALWPALTAHRASALVETLTVDPAAHCLTIEVAGEHARAAFEAWTERASEADLACEQSELDARCTSAAITLDLEHVPSELEPPLTALEMESDPISRAEACVSAAPRSLSSIDARLHRNGLLEPWRELHDRLGAHRFQSIEWSRADDGAHDLVVRYRGDEEAFELADAWAREAGLSGVGGAWSLDGSPISLALELRGDPEPIVELRLSRGPSRLDSRPKAAITRDVRRR